MRFSSPPTCPLRQGGKNDEVIQQIKELKMKKKKCEFHDCEFIPCIVNVTSFIDSLNYPKTKHFPMSWHLNCPKCEQEHWQSVKYQCGTFYNED